MASPRKAPLAVSDRNRQPCRLMASFEPHAKAPVEPPPDSQRLHVASRLNPPALTNSTTTSPSLSSNTPSPTRPSSRRDLLPVHFHHCPPVPPIPPLPATRKRLSSQAFPTELPAIIDPSQTKVDPGAERPGLPTPPSRPAGLAPPRHRPERDTRNSLDFILSKPSDEERRPPPPPQATTSVLRSHVAGPPPYPPHPQQYPIPPMHPAHAGQHISRPYAGQYEMPHPPQQLVEPPLDNRQKRQKSNLEVPPEIDVTGIHLDGEPHGVPVYDTCDTVREKIRSLLRKDGITQAAFLRELGKVYDPPRKLQSKSLNDFLVKSGPRAGNTSCIYYSGYVFFEKKRIRDQEPKTKHRKRMEEIYHPKGCNTTEVRNRIYTRVGEHYWEDEFGLVHTS